MLIPVRTGVDLRRYNAYNSDLYQLKVDVGMLNTVRFIELTFGALALRRSKSTKD